MLDFVHSLADPRMAPVAWAGHPSGPKGGPTASGGFTLIELVVVLGILTILIGLLLPAVQSARESGRRLECQSRLGQIGKALANHVASNGSFPYVAAIRAPEAPRPPAIGLPARCYSPYVALLPYLESPGLFAGFNFASPASGFPRKSRPEAENETVASTSLSSFLCPSDGSARVGSWGGSNFRYNLGVTLFIDPGEGIGPVPTGGDTRGAFVSDEMLSPAEYSDGLSNTVFLSEKIRGIGGNDFDPFADFWYSKSLPQSHPDLIAACSALRNPPNRYYNSGGSCWSMPSSRFTSYRHDLTPNTTIPDCSVAWNDRDNGDIGCITARSRHPGGVNVLFGDGRVSWIGEGVATATWRSLGTRNGSEIDAP